MKTRQRDKDEHYDRREKNADEKFCETCGFIVKATSNMCPNCKTSFRFSRKNTPKDKETALIFAIFLSFITWVYTYEKSFIKFWVGAVVSIFSFTTTVLLLLLGVSLWILGLIPIFGIWVFAIIDTSIKTKKYFENKE